MINIFTAIKNSYFKSLKGEEKLWKVIWLWGVFLYVGSIAVGFAMIFYHDFGQFVLNYLHYDQHKSADNFFLKIYATIISNVIFIPMGIVGVFGLILAFLYPLVLAFSLFKCSINKSFKHVVYAVLFLCIFLKIHLIEYKYIGFGSMLHLASSGEVLIIGPLLAIFLTIFITFKTIKSLTQKP
jgi:hypothetical protein